MAERVERRPSARPFLSICVPQYNRTSFLLAACRSIAAQEFRDFELCISDDRSTDGRAAELIEYLRASGIPYVWELQEKNRRYDGNLRSALRLARGEYCFLLGNDDGLAGPSALTTVASALRGNPDCAVAIANYEDFATGQQYRRVSNGRLGAGVGGAIRLFRHVSFVSGVVLRRAEVEEFATDAWDGSEMYQMYLVASALAAGGSALGIGQSIVRKDIRIAGESVDSYASGGRLDPCPLVERPLNLVWIPRLIAAAVEPYTSAGERSRLSRSVAAQLLAFTYPFWLFEYRRVQSWKYSAGIALGMRPRNLLKGVQLGFSDEVMLRLLYAAVTTAGLTLPRALFERMRRRLFALAKSTRARAELSPS
jgi:glycosyltransferase involved in cell wall biosynthesis